MKVPYTSKQIQKVTKFYAKKYKQHGLCYLFDRLSDDSNGYKHIPLFLRALGGKSKNDWFWDPPPFIYLSDEDKEKNEQAAAYRLTMLAFMQAWSEDPDFEV